MTRISPAFHIQLYCAMVDTPAEQTSARSTYVYNGFPLALDVPPNKMSFFGSSFEELLERLLSIRGVYAEGDGSWSWTAEDKNERQQPSWRIEGMIYDRDERVFYVDMQGQCTPVQWRTMIEALRIPSDCRLAVCIAQLGVWIDPKSFEIWLQSECL